MGMGDKSDVAAVTYRKSAADLTVYYSANRPNPNRRDHIESIANTIGSIVPNQRVKTPAIQILLSCLERRSRKIKQRFRKFWKASTDLVYWDMHRGNLEEFVQSICRPGADYSQALLFFKLLQQATGDVSGPIQHKDAMVKIMYFLSMSCC